MKKAVLIICVAILSGHSQVVNAQAIPDSSFSVWTHNSQSTPYDDPNPTPMSGAGWQELNFASSPLFGASPVSVFKDSINYKSSKYSAKIVTTVYNSLTAGLLNLKNDTMGVMFTGTIDQLSGKLTAGVPFIGRPTTVNFWYEYAPVGIDTGFVYIRLSKWNSMKSKQDTVAQGWFYTTTNVSSFTKNVISMIYSANYLSSGNPDTAVIFTSSSSLNHKKAMPGSTLWLDDFTWGGLSSAIDNVSLTADKISIYPNPAKNSITFSGNNNQNNVINIYDITGKNVKTIPMKTINKVVNTEDLSSGLYIYRITDNEGNTFQTGKVNILK